MRLPLLVVLMAAAGCCAPSSTQEPQPTGCATLGEIPQSELDVLFPGHKVSSPSIINGTRVSCGCDLLYVKSVKGILNSPYMVCGSDGFWAALFGFRKEKFLFPEVACVGDSYN